MFKNIFYVLFGVISVSYLHAGDSLEQKVTDLEKKIASFSSQNSLGNQGIELSPGNGQTSGANIIFSFDVLYLHPKVNGTFFVSSTDKVNITDTVPFKGTVTENNMGWNYGFRVGLGTNLKHDAWDLNVFYTRFRGADHKNVVGTSVDVLMALKSTYDGPALEAKSSFLLNIDSIEASLGKNFFVSKDLSICPILALKTSWIDQHQRVDYTGGSVLTVNTLYDHEESDFWGIGPKLGCQGFWFFDQGVHLFGAASASLLYGSNESSHKEVLSNDSSTSVNISSSKHSFTPNMALGVGLGWRGYANHKKLFLDFGVGYELEYYWDQYQILEVTNSTTKRFQPASYALSMQGIVGHLSMTF